VPVRRLLFLGDIFGEPGMRAVEARLAGLVQDTGAHLVVANGENSAAGLGINAAGAQRLLRAGVQVITTGNHVWHKRELLKQIDDFPTLLRPANSPPGAPGRGWCVGDAEGVPVAVVCLVGRVFMNPTDCPFQTADAVLEELPEAVRVVLVDFHAEATSEKQALGRYLDGRVSAVLGTHTHVATADAQVLPRGSGYMTDVGMTGPRDSVIGMPIERAVRRFVTQLPQRPGVGEGPAPICGAVVEVAVDTGRCLRVERVEG
jgi:metallophosphoesterase (TIGR00282 family)